MGELKLRELVVEETLESIFSMVWRYKDHIGGGKLGDDKPWHFVESQLPKLSPVVYWNDVKVKGDAWFMQ